MRWDDGQWPALISGLLFPDGIAEHRVRAVDDMIVEGGVNISTLRRVLGTVDSRDAPSPFIIRPSDDDIVLVPVGGLKVAVDRADHSVSVAIIDGGVWEPHIEATLRHFLVPGATFVDIGANVGYHTVLGASLVGPTGAVHSFEPNPDNARLIAHSIDINGLQNTKLYPVALSDALGYAWFKTAVGSNGGFVDASAKRRLAPSSTVVPTVRFDDLAIGDIDVIKIDVEGAEPIALSGALDTIRCSKPVIVFEFSCAMTEQVSGVTPSEHLESIVALGYRLHLISKTTAELVPVESVAELMAGWGDRYRIEDFVAIPDGGPTS